MEIHDESELTELELERQRNIIKNHEFMKSCFWEDCDEFYYGECTVHTSMLFLADKTHHASDDKKSLATLPDGLEIKEILIPNAGLGVFATQNFDVGVRFGPYQGKKVRPDIPRDDIDTSYMWEIMKDGHVAYYVNRKDEDHGNWMRYINCSRVEVEQNLVAYQYHRHIYYRTYKPMEAGDELLVWYGDEYAKDLGIDLHADENQLELQTGASDKKNIKLIGGKDYECSKCLKKFEFNIYYEYHMRHSNCSNHVISDVTTTKMKSAVCSGGGKTYACTVCDYKSKYSSNLKNHMRTHTKEKPFVCTVCEYKCSELTNLKNHMRTHSNEKPFACTVCEYKCSQSVNLKTHMRIHNNEKPYACTVCEYKFSLSTSLKRHMRTHKKKNHLDKQYVSLNVQSITHTT